jgi:hypothetical protein
MIFGLDVFAKVEFAHTVGVEFRVWNEICNSIDNQWVDIAPDYGNWVSVPVDTATWLSEPVQSVQWNIVEQEDTDWVEIDPPPTSIKRC